MKYKIAFRKEYTPSPLSIEFGKTIAIVCDDLTLCEPVFFTFYENYNNAGKLRGRCNGCEIEVNIGEASIEELVELYCTNLRGNINGHQWKFSNVY